MLGTAYNFVTSRFPSSSTGKVHAEVHADEVDCGSGGSDGAVNGASGDSRRVTLRSLAVDGSSQHSKQTSSSKGRVGGSVAGCKDARTADKMDTSGASAHDEGARRKLPGKLENALEYVNEA